MPTNLYPAPFSKWHQGPIVLPAGDPRMGGGQGMPFPGQHMSPQAPMSPPQQMQQHMSPPPHMSHHMSPTMMQPQMSMMPMHGGGTQGPGAVLTNGMANPFVHHNLLSTAGPMHAYNASSHSILPPNTGFTAMSYNLSPQQHQMHRGPNQDYGHSIYPDMPPVRPDDRSQNSRECSACRDDRSRRSEEHHCAGCAARRRRTSSSSHLHTNSSGRHGQSSPESGQSGYEVYRRERGSSERQRESSGSQKSRRGDPYIRSPHSPSPEPQSQQPDRLNPATREDLTVSFGKLGLSQAPRPGPARGSGGHQPDGAMSSMRHSQPHTRNLPVAPDYAPRTEEVYPLPEHQLSPSRQHREVYQGHRPATMNTHSRLHRDPQTRRDFGRD